MEVISAAELKLTFILCCLVASCSTFACSPVEENALAALELDVAATLKEQGNSAVVDFGFLPSQCKSWPQKAGFAILAKPYLYESRENGERYFGMAIAVANEKTGTVLSKINEKKLMFVDAIEPSDVSIDTANYRFKSNEPAFGVRTARRNYSDAAPVREVLMDMYIPSGDRIRRVAGPIVMSSYNGEGGGGCEFSGTEKTVSISILGSKTNSYFDMHAAIKQARIKYVKNESECEKTVGSTSTAGYNLKFNGLSYEIPRALQGDVN
ncbi:hypothetical protein [Paraburkholderia terricola]|uniref:hypothetical protein n=1 Tax=Paraburkholderia terricola TaxID=169427 RepID=UPI00285BC503|nr:hypothetical protein [Paraburkholderia terricola]MDR6482003.1 hypothetical protein [Paraburkholderia terricola]